MEYYSPKGLSDILPEEITYWQKVEEEVRNQMAQFRYREIRTPIMEKTSVFSRGVGEGTEVVSKQMYTFEDKGGRSITLRPEATAAVVRAYLENGLYGREELSKLYYLGPMFRYEAPQKGRSRQFHQYGAEAIGSNDPALDVEMIELGLSILSSLGVTDLGLALNSIGCPEDRKDYIQELKTYLEPRQAQLCSDCQQRLQSNPLRVLDCKKDRCSQIAEQAPRITNYLCEQCHQHFQQVQHYADELGIEYRLDPTLVRGLDYYTKTVFEVFSSALGAQDALIGGGRYDGLVEIFGGDPTPAVGLAGGMERLVLVMQQIEGVEFDPPSLQIYIATLDEKTKRAGINLLQRLRNAGLRAETDYLSKSLQGQLGYADRYNADYTVILGPEELSRDELTVRDMDTGNQETISLSNPVPELQNLLKDT